MNLLGMGTIGGLTSSFTGGDFFEGFMSGLNIGTLNHKWEILPDGTPHCILDDVVIYGHIKTNIPTIKLIRLAEKKNSTLGRYSVESGKGNASGFILERGGPETFQSKLNRRIPAGIYDMQLTWSPRFNKKLYLIYNNEVHRNRGIRLHGGNYYYDSHGCLLPGRSYGINNNEFEVKSSQSALNEIMRLLNPQKSRLIIIDSIR